MIVEVMPMSWRESLLHWVNSIGGQFTDTDLQTQKTALVAICLVIPPVGAAWTLVEFSEGNVASAIIMVFTIVLVTGNFL